MQRDFHKTQISSYIKNKVGQTKLLFCLSSCSSDEKLMQVVQSGKELTKLEYVGEKK